MKKEIFKDLNTSPLFNLSLGSKELFHSNFLCWFANVKDFGNGISGKELFVKWFSIVLNSPVSIPGKWTIEREFRNLDLSIWKVDEKQEKTECLFLIENKVKSVPDYEQLKTYKEYFETTKDKEGKEKNPKANQSEKPKLILFSVIENFLSKKRIKDELGYQIIDYKTIAEGFKTIINEISNQYYKDILRDYISFVENLYELCNEYQLKDLDKKFNLIDREEIVKLRLNDLIGKLRVAEFSSLVQEKLKEKKLDKLIGVSHGFYHGIELMECWFPKEMPIPEVNKIKLKEHGYKVSFVIQIQGNHYLHAVRPCKEESYKGLIEQFNWFWSANNRDFQEKMKSDTNIFTNNKCRNLLMLSYGTQEKGHRFAYQYAIISNEATVEEVLDYLIKDLEKIISNSEVDKNGEFRIPFYNNKKPGF